MAMNRRYQILTGLVLDGGGAGKVSGKRKGWSVGPVYISMVSLRQMMDGLWTIK